MKILPNGMLQFEHTRQPEYMVPLPIHGALVKIKLDNYMPFMLAFEKEMKGNKSEFLKEIQQVYNFFYKDTIYDIWKK